MMSGFGHLLNLEHVHFVSGMSGTTFNPEWEAHRLRPGGDEDLLCGSSRRPPGPPVIHKFGASLNKGRPLEGLLEFLS
jgi:hypothetical protein